MTKINCTKATQYVNFLTRAAIDMRYLAGDLNSWADEIRSPRADIKTLTNRLDNCIAKLLATRRATSSIRAAWSSHMEPLYQPVHSDQAAPFASANLPKGENNVAPGESSNGASHPRESGVEIRLQILDVLEADGKAQGGTRRIPRRRAAITPTIEGNDKALEAAP